MATSPCKKKRQSLYFEENDKCIIFNTTSNYTGYDYVNNNSYYDYENEIVVNKFFNITDLSKIIKHNSSLYANDSYVESNILEEECDVLKSLDDMAFYLIIVIPLAVYLLSVFVLCIICFKYRNIRRNYERLSTREDSSIKEEVRDERRIEM
jgi:hypothetical protein